MKQTLHIENMSCQHCVNRVTENLSNLEHISQVAVDLDQKTATVHTQQPYDKDSYQQALSKTIYKVTEVIDQP